MSSELVRLHRFIVQYYSLEELRTICFDLGINYDDLGGEGINAKSRELLLQLGRQHQFDKLMLSFSQTRPNSFHKIGFSTNSEFLDNLYSQLPSISNAVSRSRDENIVLRKVKTFWVEGVLENSLYNADLIELGKEYQPQAIEYPWETVVQHYESESRILPKDKPIIEIFDEANESLIILGQPGSGKTTMLLELARTLISRAEENPKAAIPIVFNLSSWQSDESLIYWIVNELNEKYLIPKHIGRSWVEENRIAFLLDGLDEVKPEHQQSCVQAINQFRKDYLTGTVVCSRLDDYKTIQQKLKLDVAISLQPLTPEQIQVYIAEDPQTSQVIQGLLESDHAFRHLAQSPLMLNVIMLTKHTVTLSNPLPDEEYRRHLLDVYAQQMLKRRGTDSLYQSDQTTAWLSWLAYQMLLHGQSIFLLDQIQPNWLAKGTQRLLYFIWSRSAIGLLLGLLFGITNYPFATSAYNPAFIVVLSWMVIITLGSNIVGIIDWFRSEVYYASTVKRNKAARISWDSLFYIIVVGLIGIAIGSLAGWGLGWPIGEFSRWLIGFVNRYTSDGILTGPLGTPVGGLLNGTIGGIMGGLFGGIAFLYVFAIKGYNRSSACDIQTIEGLAWSWRGTSQGGLLGLGLGLLFRVVLGSKVGIVFVFILGLSIGLLGGLRGKILETKNTPNQGILLTLRNALSGALIVGSFSGVSVWLTVGVESGIVFGTILGGIMLFGYGGGDVVKHVILRLIFWRKNQITWNFAGFLDHTVNLLFMRRVGGGYIFMHRMLMEYFASLAID